VRPFDNSRWDEYKKAAANEEKQMFVDNITHNPTHLAEILMKKRWAVLSSDIPVFITDTPALVPGAGPA
jgi:hypothetical protein